MTVAKIEASDENKLLSGRYWLAVMLPRDNVKIVSTS